MQNGASDVEFVGEDGFVEKVEKGLFALFHGVVFAEV